MDSETRTPPLSPEECEAIARKWKRRGGDVEINGDTYDLQALVDAPEDVPCLLDTVEALREECGEWEAAAARANEDAAHWTQEAVNHHARVVELEREAAALREERDAWKAAHGALSALLARLNVDDQWEDAEGESIAGDLATCNELADRAVALNRENPDAG